MKKTILIISIIVASIIIIFVALSCVARFVLLSPSCYLGNEDLTEEENYFIKKSFCIKGIDKDIKKWYNNSTCEITVKEQ